MGQIICKKKNRQVDTTCHALACRVFGFDVPICPFVSDPFDYPQGSISMLPVGVIGVDPKGQPFDEVIDFDGPERCNFGKRV